MADVWRYSTFFKLRRAIALALNNNDDTMDVYFRHDQLIDPLNTLCGGDDNEDMAVDEGMISTTLERRKGSEDCISYSSIFTTGSYEDFFLHFDGKDKIACSNLQSSDHIQTIDDDEARRRLLFKESNELWVGMKEDLADFVQTRKKESARNKKKRKNKKKNGTKATLPAPVETPSAKSPAPKRRNRSNISEDDVDSSNGISAKQHLWVRRRKILALYNRSNCLS
mmetsp:Transcript_32207/g.54966  ORF Transcript_32207/g.54966 Transcript_32207/m.54966 type:complete len:225 (+) Transcript_32207:77-751(+)